MSFLDRIQAANQCEPRHFRPFRIGARCLGYIKPHIAEALRDWPQVFQMSDEAVALTPALTESSLAERTAAVAKVTRALQQSGVTARYWWDELYAVNDYFGEPPQLLIERGAIQAFGVCGYGVHLNGYVRTPQGLQMWIGRRARDKPTAPGQLDQLVAGGQPANIGLRENIIKECAEEAAIPAELAAQARPVGAVTYCLETDYGLRPDVLYCFDLELPPDFSPRNTDGEVEGFYLWPVEQVLERVRDSTEFKFNCALVVIDFLARHGYLDPEDRDYLAILHGLRQRESLLQQFPK